MDCNLFADDARAMNLHRRIDDRIRADLDIGIDESALGIDDRDTFRHQFFTLTPSHHAIDRRKFLAGVDSKNLFGILNLECTDLLPLIYEDSDDVCEVVLALRVLVADLR